MNSFTAANELIVSPHMRAKLRIREHNSSLNHGLCKVGAGGLTMAMAYLALDNELDLSVRDANRRQFFPQEMVDWLRMCAMASIGLSILRAVLNGWLIRIALTGFLSRRINTLL